LGERQSRLGTNLQRETAFLIETPLKAENPYFSFACLLAGVTRFSNCTGGLVSSLGHSSWALLSLCLLAAATPGAAAAGDLTLQLGRHYYAITNLDDPSGFMLRGQAGSQGYAHDSIFLAPHTRYREWILQINSMRVGVADYTTPASGQTLQLPEFLLQPTTSPDSDGDGLSDLAEFILGTDPHKWSTANDGVSDGEKITQGLDPLSGAGLATGPIASLPLAGVAKEIAVTGSTTSSGQQTAYLACGSRGLSIVNVSQFRSPVLLGQLDLPGDCQDISVESSLSIAALAAGAGGLHFVNVAISAQPQVLRTINVNVSQVEVVRGIAYAAVGSQIWSYDLLTGERLQNLTLGGGAIVGLASEGLVLYTLDVNRTLRAIDITEPLDMVARGSLTMPAGTGKLFVGNGIAYLCAANGTTGGFATANVSNPDSLTLVKGVDAPNVEGGAIAANGSGLALVVGYVRGPQGQSITALDVMNVSDPANTGAFVTRYNLPVQPYGIAVGSGIAFVADGTAGLQVVNYRSFDTQGQPPTIALISSFQMPTPTNGVAEEGKAVRVAAITADDVQVRDVEFYLDGAKQLTDVSFPFEYRFTTPSMTATETNFTLQAKATDTGGNTTWTPLITVALVPDATPPRVTRTSPTANGFAGSANALAVYFSEAVQPATLTAATVQLKSIGNDGIPGTADDSPVTNGVISYRSDLNAAFLTFPTNLPPGGYLASVSPPIADLAGNTLAAPYVWRFYIIGGQDTDHDGIPDAIEIALGLDPNRPSTYNDGILDGDRDLNGDGLRAAWKLRYGYDPLKRDSFNDGILDRDRDPDSDGLTNLQEQNHGTDPFITDTDGDGYDDGTEIAQGSDPLDPSSRPKLYVIAPPPVSLVLPGLGNVSALPLNTFVARPPISLVLPGLGDAGGLRLNTSVANPPAQMVLPGAGGAAGLPPNTFVAQPPVSLVLTGLGGSGGLQLNLFVAQPEVQIVLPRATGAENLPLNTFVAQPPIQLQLNGP
jgi:hypothetical protein